MNENIKDDLFQFLHDPGEQMDFRCDKDSFTDFVKIACGIASKKICAVKYWLWIDMDVSEPQREAIKNHGTIHGHSCIEDSAGRFHAGEWVRTTPLARFHEPCIFETGSTLYIFCGAGFRKKPNPSSWQELTNSTSMTTSTS